MTRVEAVRRGAPIVVVADTAVVAARLEALVRATSSARVVVATPSDLATVITEHAPSAVVLALTAVPARALATLQHVARIPPVIVLTSTPHEAWTARARRAGVRAVLRADAGADELAAALAATNAGLLAVHPDAVGVASPATVTASIAEAMTPTPRELEVLEMMAEGMSNRAIAARLKISRHTVKFHVAAILTKLGARTRTEAVTAGVRQGLISL